MYPSDSGSLTIKSMEIEDQGVLGLGETGGDQRACGILYTLVTWTGVTTGYKTFDKLAEARPIEGSGD